jgi:chromosome segregation ATPase
MRSQTTRLPVDPAAKLTALGASIQAIDAEYEKKRAQLESEVAQAKELQRQLANLNRSVDDAAETLSRAESQSQQCQAAADQVREALLTSWGTGHADGTTDRPPSYAALVDLDAAVADFARIRSVLQQKLSTAQAALSDFSKKNQL